MVSSQSGQCDHNCNASEASELSAVSQLSGTLNIIFVACQMKSNCVIRGTGSKMFAFDLWY